MSDILSGRAEDEWESSRSAGTSEHDRLINVCLIAVAEELRRMAYPIRQDAMSERRRARQLTADDAPTWQIQAAVAGATACDDAANSLITRADELDPEGATR